VGDLAVADEAPVGSEAAQQAREAARRRKEAIQGSSEPVRASCVRGVLRFLELQLSVLPA
jgi:hypothetical protein